MATTIDCSALRPPSNSFLQLKINATAKPQVGLRQLRSNVRIGGGDRGAPNALGIARSLTMGPRVAMLMIGKVSPCFVVSRAEIDGRSV